jgi:hypothetical protein
LLSAPSPSSTLQLQLPFLAAVATSVVVVLLALLVLLVLLAMLALLVLLVLLALLALLMMLLALLALSLPVVLVLVLLVAVILCKLPAHESPRSMPLLLQAPVIPLQATDMPSVLFEASRDAS